MLRKLVIICVALSFSWSCRPHYLLYYETANDDKDMYQYAMGKYRKGYRDGKWLFFEGDTILSIVGKYKKGFTVGKWTEYDLVKGTKEVGTYQSLYPYSKAFDDSLLTMIKTRNPKLTFRPPKTGELITPDSLPLGTQFKDLEEWWEFASFTIQKGDSTYNIRKGIKIKRLEWSIYDLEGNFVRKYWKGKLIGGV